MACVPLLLSCMMWHMDTATVTATLTATPTDTPTPLATVVGVVRIVTDGGYNASDTWLVMVATALGFLLLLGTWWFVHNALPLSPE